MGTGKKTAAVSGYVSMQDGTFLLAAEGCCPSVFVDEDDYEGVLRAAEDLCEDVNAITGILPQIRNTCEGCTVIIGTLGRNTAIDAWVEQGKIDVSRVVGKWESFQVQILENRLVIAGSDQRGTIFGIYDLCEKMGVSPWKWWADVQPGHARKLYINMEEPFVQPEPSVKYRGIFINDEYAFDNWALGRKDTDFVDTYQRIYELLLRLKANLLWPAMHGGSPFFHRNIQNAANAARYGIVIGSSHCEMLLRNNVCEYFAFESRWEKENPRKPLYKMKLSDSPVPCAYVYTDRDPDTGEAVYNKEMLCDYWRESIAQYGRYECIFTIGMRGLHDATWQPVCGEDTGRKRVLLEEIIRVQRGLLQEVLKKPVAEIPQLFIPYKEIQEIYDSGMEIPEDVMLMWTDDNYGYIRRFPGEESLGRTGGAGIYYHVGYHGSPNSYIWLSTTPYALIREEMSRAYDCGAGQIWMLNVGDLKPAEGRMEYFLDLARDVETVRRTDLSDYIAQKAVRDFGFDEAQAREYAAVELGFQAQAYARKPEHYMQGLFHGLSYGDEAGRYLAAYQELTGRSEALYGSLEEADRAAFFQLQLYPLRCCRNMSAKYINADKAALAHRQKRGSAVSWYNMLSDSAYFAMLEDTKEYNSLLNGKWNLIMDPYQPYFRSRRAVLSGILPKPAYEELGYSGLGVWPEESMVFYGTVKNSRLIDICNTGNGYVDWKAVCDRDWILCSKYSGTVFAEDRIMVSIDWSRVPEGMEDARITIFGMEKDKEWHEVCVPVTVDNRKCPVMPGTFVEVDGYVSIEAEHFAEAEDRNGIGWRVEKYLGRKGDAVKLYPDRAASVEHPGKGTSAYVSYPVWFDSTGCFQADIYRIPTLNERGRMRLAVGVDGQEPYVLEGTNAYVNDSDASDSWGKGVYENTEILTARIRVDKPGKHMLHIYHMDSGMILDKIVVYTGGKKESYFGPVESRIRE